MSLHFGIFILILLTFLMIFGIIGNRFPENQEIDINSNTSIEEKSTIHYSNGSVTCFLKPPSQPLNSVPLLLLAPYPSCEKNILRTKNPK